MKRTGNKGFSLVETVVAMAIFVVIMLITGAAFKTALSNVSLVNKSEESNIEGVVGLEMFRHDIAQAGFGLPDSLNSTVPINYLEAKYSPASAYNDAPGNVINSTNVPRAVVAATTLITSPIPILSAASPIPFCRARIILRSRGLPSASPPLRKIGRICNIPIRSCNGGGRGISVPMIR